MQFAWDPVESALKIACSGETFAVSFSYRLLGLLFPVLDA